jgi:hypothetical protein
LEAKEMRRSQIFIFMALTLLTHGFRGFEIGRDPKYGHEQFWCGWTAGEILIYCDDRVDRTALGQQLGNMNAFILLEEDLVNLWTISQTDDASRYRASSDCHDLTCPPDSSS